MMSYKEVTILEAMMDGRRIRGGDNPPLQMLQPPFAASSMG